MAKDKYADKAAGRTVSKEKDIYADAKPKPVAPKTEKPDADPKAKDAPSDEKAPAKVSKGKEHIAAYLTGAKSRRKTLSQDVLDAAGQSKTKCAAKRLVRDHLRETKAA